MPKTYVEKLKAQLDKWAAEIDKLEAQAKIAGADARIELEGRISELCKQKAVLRQIRNCCPGAGIACLLPLSIVRWHQS